MQEKLSSVSSDRHGVRVLGPELGSHPLSGPFAGGTLDEDQRRVAAGAVVPQTTNRHLKLSPTQQPAVNAARSPGLRAFGYGSSQQSSG